MGIWTVFVVALTAVMGAGCRETGDIRVKSLKFSGVHAFPVSELESVLATRKSGWLPWSTKHYFDRTEFESDLNRIHAFYADHGYPNQRITRVNADVNAAHTAVDVRIDIDEGAPVIVEDVRFEGFDMLPATSRSRLGSAPLKANAPRDRNRVRASRDLAVGLLRNEGYPVAYVDASERPGADATHVVVSFRADPGALMHFGQTTVDGLAHVNSAVVRHELGFRPGDLYRESAVLRTQRRLSSLEVFQLAAVTPRVEEAKDDQVPVRITVAEGKPRQLKFGVGYGTEERARGSFDWQHLNLRGGAQQFETTGTASFLDQSVNVSYIEPYVMRPGQSLRFTGVAERLRRLTYDSESYGGRVTFQYRTERTRTAAFEPVRYNVRLTYRNEYQRYGISAASLADLSLREERIALGLDPETGRGKGTLAAVTFNLERTATDDRIQPRKGTSVSAQLEHAAPSLGGTYRYDELMLEGRAYVPIAGAVVATRAEYGTVHATDPTTVPFSKRYFLGGATSLRGWGRYQVSPLDADGLPIGGRTLVLFSSEARIPIRGKISGVAFVDAGSVGSADWNVQTLHPRIDVGPGLRYQTPIGSLRGDIGYQLTHIPGLQVNGSPELRHWRIHVSIGEAF